MTVGIGDTTVGPPNQRRPNPDPTKRSSVQTIWGRPRSHGGNRSTILAQTAICIAAAALDGGRGMCLDR